MFVDTDITAFADGNSHRDWAKRAEHWIAASASNLPTRRRRERNSAPLILCGHGTSLRVEDGTLVIRDGFTHYPQAQACYRYFPGGREIPTRILLLDGSGTLSFDVLSWLGQQGVALVRVKWTGEIATVASGSGFASDRAKVDWQHQTRSDETARFAFMSDLIGRKLANTIVTVQRHCGTSRYRDAAIEVHRQSIEQLRRLRESKADDVRGIEGRCAAAYFMAWQGLALNWKGSRPVPDAWQVFTSRSSLANGLKPQNKSASHPINAMLNYAYAVKMAHLQIGAIGDGYDPTVGIMHHAQKGKPAFIFDLIEPERPLVDATILDFAANRTFTATDFLVRPDGACRLSPQLARAVASLMV